MALSDWEKAYQLFDGSMEGCLGSSCSKSCCEEKVFQDGRHRFRASFLDSGEYYYQEGLKPSFEELGIEVHRLPVESLLSHTSFLINNCLDENGCKLEPLGRKPMLCRVSPVGFSSTRGDSECPARDEIIRLGGDELDAVISAVDSAIGLEEMVSLAREAARRARNRLLYGCS